MVSLIVCSEVTLLQGVLRIYPSLCHNLEIIIRNFPTNYKIFQNFQSFPNFFEIFKIPPKYPKILNIFKISSKILCIYCSILLANFLFDLEKTRIDKNIRCLFLACGVSNDHIRHANHYGID